MENLNASFKRFTVFFLVFAVITSITAFSSLALLDTNDYDLIQLTYEQINAMFEAGDATYNLSFGGDLYLFPLDNSDTITSSYPRFSSSSADFNIDRVYVSSTQRGTLLWFPYCYSNFLQDDSSYVVHDLALPFDFYMINTQLTFRFFVPGTRVDTAGNNKISIGVYDENNNMSILDISASSLSTLATTNVIFDPVWNTYPDYQFKSTMGNFYSIYRNQTGLSYDYKLTGLSLTLDLDSYNYAGTTNQALCGMVFYDTAVYVDKAQSGLVEEYLDLIVNPTPETQVRVEEIRQEFARIDSDLDDISRTLDVEKPDIGNAVDSIPNDLLIGSKQSAENIFAPILSNSLMVMLFTGIFAILGLKLILFGSGRD